MKKPTSFEQALQLTGRPVVDFTNVPEDLKAYFEKQYKAVVITEAIREGKKSNMLDTSEKKWFPIFRVEPKSPSGFVFGCSGYDGAHAHAGCASRLCFGSEAEADYAGETFTEIYSGIITE